MIGMAARCGGKTTETIFEIRESLASSRMWPFGPVSRNDVFVKQATSPPSPTHDFPQRIIYGVCPRRCDGADRRHVERPSARHRLSAHKV
jgi:hypothetical protein